jgi:ABC-type sugar transport system substrate-binding protein
MSDRRQQSNLERGSGPVRSGSPHELDRRAFLVASAGFLAAGGLLAACGSDAAEDGGGGPGGSRNKIAFAHPASTAPIYPLMVAGARGVADERGYELLTSHADNKLDVQITELNTWIAQRVGGIVVLPLDNAAMAAIAEKAIANDVKILNYSNEVVPDADGSVVFDNPQGAELVGEYAGRWVNETLGGEAKVALLTDNKQEAGRQRIYGALRALKAAAPDVEVVAEQQGLFAPETLTIFQSMLQAHPDINVVFCIADDGCIGTEKAFMQTNPSQGRQDQMFMAGWDGSIPVLKAIASGSVIRATGVLDLIGIGEDCSRATINAIEGTGETDIDVPYVLADQEHPDVAREFVSRYEAIIG